MAGAVLCWTSFCLPFVISSVFVQPRTAAAELRATLKHTARAASNGGMALLELILSFRPQCYECNFALSCQLD